MFSWGCCVSRSDAEGLTPGSARSSRAPKTAEELAALEERRSADAVKKHAASSAGLPGLLLYSVADLPASAGGDACPRETGRRTARPRAYHVPPNAPRGAPIDTQNFVGEVLWMQVPGGVQGGSEEPGGYPYAQHFWGRKRLWEFRLQGRFRRKPDGDLFVGITLRDFNYDQAVARYSLAVKRLGLLFIKWTFYLSWGDRCEASKKPDAELSHLVTGLAGFDQIIVTPEGKSPPSIAEELSGRGIERKRLGYKKYQKEVSDIVDSINTSDTYTFCYWGPSPFIDSVQWQFRFGSVIPMAQFLEEWPLHFVMYELDSAALHRASGAEGAADPRHLESRKRYFMDLLFWSSTQDAITRNMPSRYNLLDAPGTLEAESAEAAKAAKAEAVAAKAAGKVYGKPGPRGTGGRDEERGGDDNGASCGELTEDGGDGSEEGGPDAGAGTPVADDDAKAVPGAPVLALLHRLRGS